MSSCPAGSVAFCLIATFDLVLQGGSHGKPHRCHCEGSQSKYHLLWSLMHDLCTPYTVGFAVGSCSSWGLHKYCHLKTWVSLCRWNCCLRLMTHPCMLSAAAGCGMMCQEKTRLNTTYCFRSYWNGLPRKSFEHCLHKGDWYLWKIELCCLLVAWVCGGCKH